MKDRYYKKSNHGKNFYVALGICLVAVGAAAFFTYTDVGVNLLSENKTESVQSEADNNVALQLDKQVDEVLTSQNASSAQSLDENKTSGSSSAGESSSTSSSASSSEKNVSSRATTQTVANIPTLFAYPTEKTVTKAYSGDTPVYSLTMNDWRVHTGIDLAAGAGSTVKAIADGVVKDIYNDQSLGTTIVIEHPDNIVASYSGLGETTLVKVGENVVVEQEIGSIKGVPCEILEENHLHLSIKKDGNFVDPMTVLENAKESTSSDS